MNQILYIKTSFDQPELLEYMVEELADRRYNIGKGRTRLPNLLQAFDTSSIENYVTGSVELSFDDEANMRIPFITCLLFICTKEKNDPYKLNWLISLS